MSDQGIPAWLQSLGFTEPTEEEKAGNVLKAGAIFLGPPEPISIEEWDRVSVHVSNVRISDVGNSNTRSRVLPPGGE